MIEFTVRGNPKSLKRAKRTPLFFRDENGIAKPRMDKNGRVILVTRDPSEKDKENFMAVVDQYAPAELLLGPLYLELHLFFQRPKSHYVANNRERELKQSSPIFHEGKFDVSNCVKFVEDAMNKKFFPDDGQISVEFVYKKWASKFAFVRVKLMTVPEWLGEVKSNGGVKEYNKQLALL